MHTYRVYHTVGIRDSIRFYYNVIKNETQIRVQKCVECTQILHKRTHTFYKSFTIKIIKIFSGLKFSFLHTYNLFFTGIILKLLIMHKEKGIGAVCTLSTKNITPKIYGLPAYKWNMYECLYIPKPKSAI